MQSENLAHIMHSNSTSFRNKACESTHAVVVIKICKHLLEPQRFSLSIRLSIDLNSIFCSVGTCIFSVSCMMHGR